MMVPEPNFEQRTRESFAKQPAMSTMGVEIESVEEGRVVLAMVHRADLTQQHGFLHAGVVATALDSACGYAAYTMMPSGAGVLTIEFKVNLLAPARGPSLRFEGRVVKSGRTISVVDGTAFQFDQDRNARKLVATMTATVMTVLGREDVRH
jgi:uncharacterized protein (TIGR00369 family)